MNDEKFKTIMEMFANLNHGEQVDLFLDIKQGLLDLRKQRIETHQKNIEYDSENVKALYAGNDRILGNLPTAEKASS